MGSPVPTQCPESAPDNPGSSVPCDVRGFGNELGSIAQRTRESMQATTCPSNGFAIKSSAPHSLAWDGAKPRLKLRLFNCTAARAVSLVRMRTTSSTGGTKILPSPILSVRAASQQETGISDDDCAQALTRMHTHNATAEYQPCMAATVRSLCDTRLLQRRSQLFYKQLRPFNNFGSTHRFALC